MRSLLLALSVIAGVFAAPAATRTKRALDKRGDYIWGGAIQEGPPGTGWNFVQGSVVVPSFSGSDNQHSANMWVGIDGNDCTSAILQTRLVAYGNSTFWLWTKWWKNDIQDNETNLDFSPSDTLRFTVHAKSTTSSTTTVKNLSTGNSVSHTSTSESQRGDEIQQVNRFNPMSPHPHLATPNHLQPSPTHLATPDSPATSNPFNPS